MNGAYDDIINLPHHVSSTRPQMPMIDRAAQFSPFAALTGYDAAVKETARLTDARVELDECAKVMLNEKLQMIAEGLKTGGAAASITYFKPDERKSGGAYLTAEGAVKRIDIYRHMVIMTDGTVIPIEEIFEIAALEDDRTCPEQSMMI